MARGVFYLLLAGLAGGVLVSPGDGDEQANANGAMTQVAGTAVGGLLLAAAAVGFAAFGVARLLGAATDRRHDRLRRLSTAGQGLLYLGMAALTAGFLLGQRATGSEEQQHRTAGSVLALPGGRWILAGVGVIILVMCGWQLRVAAKGHFEDSLSDRMGRRAHRLTVLTARVGIPARALAVMPVGVLLVVAAWRADPREAKGLDTLILQAVRTPWGRMLVTLVIAGFVVFALYSFLEARYRTVSAGA